MKDRKSKNSEIDFAATDDEIFAMAEKQKTEPSKQPTVEVVSYTDWFSAKLREHKKLKPSHYETIKAFFRNQKLTEHETKATFDSMLKVFGF